MAKRFKRIKRAEPDHRKVVLQEVLTDSYIGTGFAVREGDYVSVWFDINDQTVTVKLSRPEDSFPVKPDKKHQR